MPSRGKISRKYFQKKICLPEEKLVGTRYVKVKTFLPCEKLVESSCVIIKTCYIKFCDEYFSKQEKKPKIYILSKKK